MAFIPLVSGLLELVDLIVERLQADAELLGGGRLVAVVLLEDDLDVLHLDVAQGRVPLGDLEVRTGNGRAPRRGRDPSARVLGGEVLGTDRPAAREDRGAFD